MKPDKKYTVTLTGLEIEVILHMVGAKISGLTGSREGRQIGRLEKMMDKFYKAIGVKL